MGEKQSSFISGAFVMFVLTLIAGGIVFSKLGVLQINLVFVAIIPFVISLICSAAVKDK